MEDFLVLSVGRAILPAVSFAFTCAGHFLVSAHQMMSSRKLFPRPLSPVRRLRRLPNSNSISAKGPTFESLRESIMMPLCPSFKGFLFSPKIQRETESVTMYLRYHGAAVPVSERNIRQYPCKGNGDRERDW